MTTIIADAREGLMASDSQWSDGDAIGLTRKIFRSFGSLIGFAGSLDAVAKAREWFRRGSKGKFVGGSDVVALILRPDRTVWLWDPTSGFVKEDSPFFAVGTGGAAARGAMMAGASARSAVAIASKIDPGTGGRVRVYKLREK